MRQTSRSLPGIFFAFVHCRKNNCCIPLSRLSVFKAPIKVSGFREGVWGITLFPPEKGFPQKSCPTKVIPVSSKSLIFPFYHGSTF